MVAGVRKATHLTAMIDHYESNDMRIDVQTIQEEEIIELSHTYDPGVHDIDFFDWHVTSPIVLRGSAQKRYDTLTVHGTLASKATVSCSRCLQEDVLTINEVFDQVYDIKGLDSIDITDDVREHIVLLHPEKYICKDTCKGLCPQCGVNLNEETCSCTTVHERTETAFANLKEIMQHKKKKE